MHFILCLFFSCLFVRFLRLSYSWKFCFQEIPEEEFGAELRTKLKFIIEECLRAESSRPGMQRVLQILNERLNTQKNRVELFCVGTGQGTTGIQSNLRAYK